MSRRVLIFILFAGLALSAAFTPRQGVARVVGLPNFTIPTRTPVPSPTTEQPTAEPPTAEPPTAEPPTAVPPTNVPPTATQTKSVPPAIGFLPTAVACGVPPTLQVQSNARVRSGPGANYAIVADMVYLDVRVIVGRAADAPWWLVDLGNGQSGWVADSVARVQGYTGNVPIMAAPAINGQTPTPGASWQPTAVPDCAPIPSQTPIPPTAAATNTAAPNPTDTATAVSPTTAPVNVALAAYPLSTATSVVPTAEAVTENLVEEGATPVATAVPLAPVAAGATALPCASAIIGLAVVGFVASRRFW